MLMTNEVLTRLMYITPTRQMVYVTDVNGVKYWPSHHFEHLSCFFPGLLALGAAPPVRGPTDAWGAPEASFPLGQQCGYGSHFNAHSLVFDLTFCVSVVLLTGNGLGDALTAITQHCRATGLGASGRPRGVVQGPALTVSSRLGSLVCKKVLTDVI